jgi:hypothetical protein
MKNRISSIMDTKRKRGGVIILCAVLAVILITGAALAASGKQVSNWSISVAFYNPGLDKTGEQDASSPGDRTQGTQNATPGSTASEHQDVLSFVENFGKSLQRVTLQAPRDVAVKMIEEHYSEYATPELLALWQSDLQYAPGRVVSSPWPERIEITGIKSVRPEEYIISGEIIMVTSTEMVNGGAAARQPVTLRVTKQDDRWLISGVTIAETGSAR